MAAVDLVVLGSPPGGDSSTCCFRPTVIVWILGSWNLFMCLPYLVSDIKNEIGKNK